MNPVRIGDQYSLTPEERFLAMAIGRERYPGSGNALEMMFHVAGLIAFAKLAGVENESWDGVWYRGHWTAIKTSTDLDPQLLVPLVKDEGNRIYGLMVMTDRQGPTFEFKGFAEAGACVRSVPSDNLLEWFCFPQWFDTCEEHRILACLDCPDPYFTETPALTF